MNESTISSVLKNNKRAKSDDARRYYHLIRGHKFLVY